MAEPTQIEIEMKVSVDCPIKGACPHVKAAGPSANKICDACEKKHDENIALLEAHIKDIVDDNTDLISQAFANEKKTSARIAELEAERDAAQSHIKELYDERGKRMIMWDAIVAERDSLRVERDAARAQYKAASVRADLHEANGATAIHERATARDEYAKMQLELLKSTTDLQALQSRIDAAIKFIHRNGPNAQDAAEDRILRTLIGMHLKDAGTATADFERTSRELTPCPCCNRTGQPAPAMKASVTCRDCGLQLEHARADELQKRIDKAVEELSIGLNGAYAINVLLGKE